MKTTKVIFLVVVILAICGAYLYPQTKEFLGVSPTGSTFNSAKVAAIVFAPATGSATSTSILNSDANDRYVTDSFSYCQSVGTSFTAYTGTGLTELRFKGATTSTASPAAVSNTNFALNVIVATSSVYSANATSTFVAAVNQVWPSGSYMTFTSNATNTAICTVGVNYVAS